MNNIKLLLIFLFIIILFNIILYYIYDYEHTILKKEPDYFIHTQVFLKSPIETNSINLLTKYLSQIHTMINKAGQEYNIKIESSQNIFDLEYLFRNFFDIFTNPNVIREVLISQEIVDKNKDQDLINELIISYTNNITKEFINHESSNKPGIDIKLKTFDNLLDKNFIESLIVTSSKKIREIFIENLNLYIKEFKFASQNIKQKKLNSIKTLDQLKLENNELQKLNLHYQTALRLNIIKPKLLTNGDYSSISSPLFYQIGTENLLAMIKTIEFNLLMNEAIYAKNKIDAEYKNLIANIQYSEKKLNELIDISGINNQDELFLIYFSPSKIIDNYIVPNVTNPSISVKNIHYLLYLIVLFIGVLSFVGVLLIKENYKKYKLN